MKDIYDIIAESKRWRSESLVLATLVRAQGSSYRRPGARLLVCPDGLTVGSLSGGCIEDEIAARARQVIASGHPVVMEFDTRRQYGCHGKIDIFIERVNPGLFVDIERDLSARHICLVVTTPDGSLVKGPKAATPMPPDNFTDDARSGHFAPLIQEVHPPIRLLLFGEGPDSVPMEKLGRLLGWQILHINDAGSLAFEPDPWTAAIVKSHNFGKDFAALRKLLPLNLRYLGLIGPKKRRDELLNELLQTGISMSPGFFAPAGVDLNAETPEEIALSIVSEIQRVFAGGSGQSLRDQKQPIHYRALTNTQPGSAWQKLPR